MRCRGFTILELIIVLAVLGLLATLLFPAVHHAREAARRTQCGNHLRQIGIALHQYHDVHACLPPGLLDKHNDRDGYGWGVFLLPYLDQGPLYNFLNPQGEVPAQEGYYRQYGTTRPGGSVIVPVFRCPSSSLPNSAVALGPAPMPAHRLGYATSDYKGSTGRDRNGLFLRMHHATGTQANPMRFALVTDGLSQTIAVGESSYPGRNGIKWPMWIGGAGADEAVLFRPWRHHPINCVPSFSGRFWMNAPGDDCALSFHPGMAFFLFGDGAVRALSENIDVRAYEALGGRNDGKVVEVPF